MNYMDCPQGLEGEHMNKANKEAIAILGCLTGFWTIVPIVLGFVPKMTILGATFYGPLGLSWAAFPAFTAAMCVLYAVMGGVVGYCLAMARLAQEQSRLPRLIAAHAGVLANEVTVAEIRVGSARGERYAQERILYNPALPYIVSQMRSNTLSDLSIVIDEVAGFYLGGDDQEHPLRPVET